MIPSLPLSEGEYKGVPKKRFAKSKPPSIPPWIIKGEGYAQHPLGIKAKESRAE